MCVCVSVRVYRILFAMALVWRGGRGRREGCTAAGLEDSSLVLLSGHGPGDERKEGAEGEGERKGA